MILAEYEAKGMVGEGLTCWLDLPQVAGWGCWQQTGSSSLLPGLVWPPPLIQTTSLSQQHTFHRCQCLGQKVCQVQQQRVRDEEGEIVRGKGKQQGELKSTERRWKLHISLTRDRDLKPSWECGMKPAQCSAKTFLRLFPSFPLFWSFSLTAPDNTQGQTWTFSPLSPLPVESSLT